jgi:uracil-DNA glycosylase
MERIPSARVLLVAEALGYQGGRFSGIPMTSERIILGYQEGKGILPEYVASKALHRTSLSTLRPQGFAEPTATIVWKALLNTGLAPNHFVFWNALAWHPYVAEKGQLSNRTPLSSELAQGQAVLKAFLELFPGTRVLAVGAKAQQALQQLGVASEAIRHPARGGAAQFRSQLLARVG